ncbi:MAG TPA: hypothetical protein VLH08_06765 [Acidobacteriota bacterium]|nr:hypothetical protein [Acidobacteriota bacterium]
MDSINKFSAIRSLNFSEASVETSSEQTSIPVSSSGIGGSTDIFENLQPPTLDLNSLTNTTSIGNSEGGSPNQPAEMVEASSVFHLIKSDFMLKDPEVLASKDPEAIPPQPPAEPAFADDVDGTVQYLMYEISKGTPNKQGIVDRLTKLSPEDLKAVLQKLDESGQLSTVIHQVQSLPVLNANAPGPLSEIFSKLLKSNNGSPDAALIQKILDNSGLPEAAQRELLRGANNDPQVLKNLPESMLMRMLTGMPESDRDWGTLYKTLQAKGPSPAARMVIDKEIRDYLNAEADRTDAADRTGAARVLTSLTPEDRKKFVQEMVSTGKFNSLMTGLSASPFDKGTGAGKIFASLLQDAQTDPQMLQLLNQEIKLPQMAGSIASFVSHAQNAPQSLSLLSENVLLGMLDALEGKPEWEIAYNALNMKSGGA